MKNAWMAFLLTILASCNAPPKLVWANEFDLSVVPDSTKWSYDLGNGCPNTCGSGSNETQYYAQTINPDYALDDVDNFFLPENQRLRF